MNSVISKTDGIEEVLKNFHFENDPEFVTKKALDESKQINKPKQVEIHSNLFKLLTLHEFENSILMTSSLPDHFKTLAISMNKQLQCDYDCKTISEKSLVEVIVINFCTILELQRKQKDLLDGRGLTRIDLDFVAILGKQIDRATRHYLTAIQILKSLKSNPMIVNVKADTAVVGQNQVVQANSKC